MKRLIILVIVSLFFSCKTTKYKKRLLEDIDILKLEIDIQKNIIKK